MPLLKKNKHKTKEALFVFKMINNKIYFYDFRKLQLKKQTFITNETNTILQTHL
jgi:hypothetical protein